MPSIQEQSPLLITKSGDFFCHTYLNFILKIHLYLNVPLEHSTRTTSWMTAIEWTTTEIRTTTRSSRTIRTTLASLLASEEIHTIDDMEHCIAVDGIILRIRTGCSRDGTREGALLTKYIVELEHHGQRLALQETLRELRIPYKLIRVHAAVIISTATADREA